MQKQTIIQEGSRLGERECMFIFVLSNVYCTSPFFVERIVQVHLSAISLGISISTSRSISICISIGISIRIQYQQSTFVFWSNGWFVSYHTILNSRDENYDSSYQSMCGGTIQEKIHLILYILYILSGGQLLYFGQTDGLYRIILS
jgi:hypothetical protein